MTHVFFTGRRIASRVTGSNSANTALFYYFADQLGSTRTITTGSGKNNDGSSQIAGQLCYDQDYTPYGQEVFTTAQMSRLQTTACPPSYKFTGYERDSETGLDYAFARYYSPRLARFLSTDPLGGGIGNLQSHNAYAYVANNPLRLTDPSGMDYCDGNSPYTSGGGGTSNLPPPCQIAPGVWDASYGGPAVTAQSLQNQTWQAVDTFFNNQGITEYAPLPTGLLNYNANQGDLGMLGSQEMAIGLKEALKRIIADLQKQFIADAWAWFLSDFLPGPELDAVSSDLSALDSLKGWQSVSVPPVPPAPCSINAGLAMGVWKTQLLAWIKSHPGQPPPPWLAFPPSLSGVCG